MGPFSLAEIIDTLATYPDRNDVFVKRDGDKSWQRPSDFTELDLPGQGTRSLKPLVAHEPITSISVPNKKAKWRWTRNAAIFGLIFSILSLIAKGALPSANLQGTSYLFGYVGGGSGMAAVIGLLLGTIRDFFGTSSAPPLRPTVLASSPKRSHYNFVANHWRGEFPLWVSYWVINVVVYLSAFAIAVLVVAAFEPKSGYNPFASFASILSIWAAITIITIWQIVGLWRSANRHTARRAIEGKKSPWAAVAKIGVILGALNLCGEFVRSALPQISESSRIAFMGDPDIPEYSFRIMRNGSEVEIRGGFKYGLTDEFRKLIKASPQVRVVHLDSIGGRIGEATKLHHVIRENGLITYVSSKCASACTIAFAAGKERYLARNAVLGFHAPAFPGMGKDDLANSVKEQSSLFTAAGFTSSFISRALNTPNADLWKPSVAELIEARAITSLADSKQFAMSGFGEVSKESLSARLARSLPLLQSIQERLPKSYQGIVDSYYASYVAGESEAASIAAIRTKIMPLLDTLKPMADDDVLVDLARLFSDSYQALGVKSPATCYFYASGTDKNRNYSDELPPALIKRELELNDRVVRTATSRVPIPDAVVDAVWAKLRKIMGVHNLTDADLELLISGAAVPSKYRDFCVASVRFYNAIAALPQKDAAIAMRSMLAQK